MRVLACLLVLTVFGCATPPPPATETNFPGALIRNGRFAVKTESANRSPEAVQGGFSWRDSGSQLALDLTNPFGGILARLLVHSRGATLERANGELIQAASSDSLMDQAVGQPIPVQGLRLWLRTQKNPPAGMRVLEKDAEGRIVAFEQDGWSVRLSNFDSLGPRLVALTRSEGGRGIWVRLVVD